MKENRNLKIELSISKTSKKTSYSEPNYLLKLFKIDVDLAVLKTPDPIQR